MKTARFRRGDVIQPLVAVAGAVALVLGLVLTPDSGTVQALGAFATLRAPGEAGYVAGHRGDPTDAPENTLPALAAAIASDAHFVETDVQLTADGVPILMHDFTLDRTTDGHGPVWAATWDEVSALDAGSWYSSDYAGTRVPLLEQFLALLAPSDKLAIVELKGSWTADQVTVVTERIVEWSLADRVVLASFDLMTLRAARDVAPGIARVVISREVNGDPADLAAECDAVAIVTSTTFVRSHPGVVDRIHGAGLGVMVYTLNDAGGWSEAIALGVDGIITDRPGEFGRWIRDASAD